MLRVDLANLKPGMKLALPVRHPRHHHRTLLKYGYRIEAHVPARLAAVGVRQVWIQYPSLDFLARILPNEMIEAQGKMVQRVTHAFEAVQNQTAAKMDFTQYTSAVTTLLTELVSNPRAAIYLGELAEGSADDLRHASTTAFLSLLMGLKLESYIIRQRRHVDPARSKDLGPLGLGAMLHDIGITHLDEEVRKHYRRTGDDSAPAFREHPTLGYDFAHGAIEPTASTIILNHHQRFDGSGYAGARIPILDGTRIHVFARIVGLAEEFDRLCHPAGRPARSIVETLRMLLEPENAKRFDPVVMRALFMVTPPYPLGSIVLLSSGENAVVIDHHPADPCRPTVQPIKNLRDFDPEDSAPAAKPIDLSKHPREIHISHAQGRNVTALNFDAPKFMGSNHPTALEIRG